jgi:uncharacterized protein YceK
MRVAVLLAVVLLSGCASIDASQCANAYDLGFRDAIMGLTPQDTLYEQGCTRAGTRLDLARYKEGWLDGHFEVDRRTPHTD